MDETPLVPPGSVVFPHIAVDNDTALVARPVVSEESVKRELGELTRRLLMVEDPVESKKLNIDIQRRRVALILIREAAGKDPDGDYHKEMSLLNRMLQGEEGGEDGPKDDATLTADAEAILAARGIDGKRAATLMHVLQALVSRVEMDGSRQPADRPVS